MSEPHAPPEISVEHHRNLIQIYSSRIRELETRIAQFGSLHVPTHIQLEIEDTRNELKKAQEKLAAAMAAQQAGNRQTQTSQPAPGPSHAAGQQIGARWKWLAVAGALLIGLLMTDGFGLLAPSSSISQIPPNPSAVATAPPTLSAMNSATSTLAASQSAGAQPTPSTAPLSPPTAAPEEGRFVQQIGAHTLSLQEARYEGGVLILTFMAYYDGPFGQTYLCYHDPCRIIDGAGTAHVIATVDAGNGVAPGADGTYFDMPSKIPYRFVLTFDSLPPDLTQIPLLEISGFGQFFELRNIPLPYQIQPDDRLRGPALTQMDVSIGSHTMGLEEARHDGGALIVTFTVYRDGPASQSYLCYHGPCRIIDAAGTSHIIATVDAGNGVAPGADGTYFDMPGKTLHRFVITFDSLPPDMAQIPLLEVDGFGELFEFRNIPVPTNN